MVGTRSEVWCVGHRLESLVLPEARKGLPMEGTLEPGGLRALRAEVAECASSWTCETGSLGGGGAGGGGVG